MADDADAAARVIERLLADPAFRAGFRRDPATACSEAGLDELAEYMAQGSGKAMHTLEVRESRSSLAGVMMAAALEGVGVFEFAKHIVPGAIAAPGAARDVLSRVNLPAIDGLRGSLAQPPEAAAGGPAEEAAPGGAAAAATNASSAMAAIPAPAQAPPAAPPEPASGAPADTPTGARPAAPEAGKPAAPSAPGSADAPATAAPASEQPAENVRYARAAAVEPASPPAQEAAAPAVEQQTAAPAVEARASGAPVDPAQFGAEGTGGKPTPESLAILENKNVVFDNDGVADIKAGRIDPRVIAVLTKLSEDHTITVSCMCSDHPTFTTGGSVSNHHHGRGVDIAAIDGVPVNAGNPMARDVATDLSSLDPSMRPDEIGSPWAISGPGYFTDADHNDHLHVGFKQAIEPSWTPPAGQAATAAAANTAAPGAPAAAPVAGSGTLSIAIPEKAGAARGAGTLSLKIAEAGGRPVAATAATAAPPAEGAADIVAPSAATEPRAGAKALAALEEAKKYMGTPYLWGGSNPDTGFDCSGLMQWAYAKQGIETGRTTYDQIDHPGGTKVDREDLLPGDLVLFRSPSGDVHHVGMSMGGDKFLHAPSTGDVVKISSLEEPYYKSEFTGGRRFDTTPGGAADATPAPEAVRAATNAVERDAAAVRNPNSMVFKALTRQEASNRSSTVQFIRAIRPEEAAQAQQTAAAAQADPAAAVTGPTDYPGNDAGKEKLAQWLAVQAQKAGLPPELPVMAALVESGVANLEGGHADSAGFFQMRVGIWDKGAYAGYRENPQLQATWFIDTALAHKAKMVAAGNADFGKDPASWGTWIADVERPAAQYRGRYQLRLDEARGLLGRKG